MDLTKKIYTFRLDIGHPFSYAMCLHPDLYQQYLECNTTNKFDNFETFEKLSNSNRCIESFPFYTLYDINNNKPNLLNICYCSGSSPKYNYAVKYYLENSRPRQSNNHRPSNNYKLFDIDESYEKDNIYIKEIYNNTNSFFDSFKKSMLNNKLIQILIDNFCKLHYIEDIKITMQSNINILQRINRLIPHQCPYILETITFVLDDREKSNNRKIKFYEHFSDFYRNKNNDKKYKIIQEPNRDGYCLIEELEELESTQNLLENKDLDKSPQEIIIDKDLEIEKLKKEIQELKKFYINSS